MSGPFELDDEDDFIVPKWKRVTEAGGKSKGAFIPEVENGAKESKRKKPNCRKSAAEKQVSCDAAKKKGITSGPLFEKVIDMLPVDYPFLIQKLESSSEDENCDEWVAVLRLNIRNREDALKWLAEFQRSCWCDYRVRNTYEENTKRIVYKRLFRCHHLVPHGKKLGESNPKKISKNTGCPANLMLTVKKGDMKWSSDSLLEEYPCEILINFNHNHHLRVPEALKHRRPCTEIENKFKDLFSKGYSPSSALESHKFDLQNDDGGVGYVVASSDRSICPDVKWAFRLYYKIYKKCYGAPRGEEMVASLKSFVNNYNEAQGDKCADVRTPNNKDLIVALSTPLMKRAHEKLRSAGEIMFMDSSGTMDAQNTRVFLMMCPSLAGALPLGVLLLSSETEEIIKLGLDLWTSLLDPDTSFNGRGIKGPKIIMTDDATSLKNALFVHFPEAVQLLCLFHVLQSFWRYVWNSEHKVIPEQKTTVYFSFRDVVYAKDKEVFNKYWDEMMKLPAVSSNAIISKHLENIKPRAAEWALCERSKYLTRGHNTNNNAEVGMRLLKDKACGRMKAFSIVQLFDFIVTRFNSYLERRIIDFVNGRALNLHRSRFYMDPLKLQFLRASALPQPNLYRVDNEEKKSSYIVNSLDELCTCPHGFDGKACKHQNAVVKQFNLACSLIANCDNPKFKKDLLYIACGSSVKIPSNWFAPLLKNGTEDKTEDSNDFASEISTSHVDNVAEVDVGEIQNSCETQEDELNSIEKDLDEMVAGWKKSLKERPDVFKKPCTAMIKLNKKMDGSDAALASAMHMFGKQVGPCTIRGGVKKIHVQPTSVSRRSAYLGGRNVNLTGRPTKSMNRAVPEHNFSVSSTKKPAGTPFWATPPNRKSNPRVPHSLTNRVHLASATKRSQHKK